MSRLQRTLLLAIVVGVGGIGATVYLAARAPRSAERVRERVERERLFEFGRRDVTRLTIHRADERIELGRDPTVSWRLDAPVQWPADLQAVEALLDRAASLRAKRTVFEAPTAENLADTGLAPPAVELEVALRDGRAHRLALGTTNPVTELMHARPDGGAVVLVEPDFRWAMDRPAEEFRMDRLFPYRTEDVANLRLATPSGESFDLVRTDDGRHEVVTEDDRFDAGRGVAAVLLAALTKRLEAEDYLGDAHPYPELPDALASFQAGSAFAITARHVTGATRSATIALARLAALDEPVPVAWVGSSVVQLYPPPVEEVLGTTAESLRDRSLARFNPSDVARVRAYFAGEPEPWIFERTGEDGRSWRRTVPRPAEGMGVILRDVLLSLARLKGERTAAESPSPAQLRDWLIEPPSRRFVMLAESGEVLADVRLGGWASEDAVYVKGDGPRVDVVSIDRLLKIPVDPDKLVKGR